MDSLTTGTTVFPYKPPSVGERNSTKRLLIHAGLPGISEYHARSGPTSERPRLPSCPCERAKVSSLSDTSDATLTRPLTFLLLD